MYIVSNELKFLHNRVTGSVTTAYCCCYRHYWQLTAAVQPAEHRQLQLSKF